MFFLYLAGQVMPAIWPFYTKFLYHWNDREIGYSLAFVGVMVSIVQGGLINWAKNRSGNTNAVYVGLAMYFIGLTLFAFANQSWMMYAFTFVYALGGIAPPTIQGIISGRVPPNKQGELQGMLTAMMSVSTILSPLIMTNLFYFFTKETSPVYFPGASFGAAAILIIIGGLMCIRGLKQ